MEHTQGQETVACRQGAFIHLPYGFLGVRIWPKLLKNNDFKVIFLKQELQIHCKESKKPEANMAMSGKNNFFIFVPTFFFPVFLKRF